MSIDRVLAVIPVADFAAACGWYEKFFGRQADANPMEGSLAEWRVTDSAWIQVFHDDAKAGTTAVNFGVDELAAELARLDDQGIPADEPQTVSKGRQRLATVSDVDGNAISLIETLGTAGGRPQAVRDMFTAFAAGDRETVERIFAGEFSFSTPLDVGLDKAGYFERCWPGAGSGNQVEFVRLLEVGDEVVATYESDLLAPRVGLGNGMCIIMQGSAYYSYVQGSHLPACRRARRHRLLRRPRHVGRGRVDARQRCRPVHLHG
jgi:predicted enzyme related to lactoylglutathione lyase